MSTKSRRALLLVEDNPGDARLLREMFAEEGGHNTEVTHVSCMSEAERHLAEHAVDIIVLDLGLPDAQGLGAVRRARAAAPRVPLVVLTGLDDDTLALQALQEGAQDYLIKGQIETRGFLRALRYAIERKILEEALMTDAAQLRASGARLRDSGQHLTWAEEVSESGSFERNVRTGQVTWSDNLYRIIAADKKNVTGGGVSELIHPTDRLAPSGIVYRPVWDVKREVLSTFLSRRGPAVGAKPDEVSRLELEALHAGIGILTDLYQKKSPIRLAFPICFEVITSAPCLRAHIDLCRTIPEPIRKLVAFELVDLPVGVQHRRLCELTIALRPYCGLVLATVDWWRADLSQFTNTGIRLVNAVIPPGSTEKRSMTDMDSFAYAAGKAGLLSAVEGVGTSSLALAAKGAGLDFISGDRIGPCLEAPNHMLRVSWSEMYLSGLQRDATALSHKRSDA